MRFPLRDGPPPLTVAVTYRELYEHGAFAHPAGHAQAGTHRNRAVPHGPAVIGEGSCEQIIVDWLLQALLGLRSPFEFHDLGGSGAAARVPRLVEILDNYAAGAFLIVDNEGEMARFVDRAVTAGKLDRENVLFASDSLEQSNFSPAELIEVVEELAATPPEGRELAS